MGWRTTGLLITVTACGGATRAPQPATRPTVVVQASGDKPLAPDPVDDSAAAQPNDVGPLIRLRSPATAWPALADIVPAIGDIHEVFGVPPGALAKVFLGRALAASIDLRQPVDIVQVGQDEDSRFVVSMALVDLDQARTTLANDFAISRRHGALVLEPTRPGADGKLGGDAACEIRAARGAAPYRLVCGPRDALPRYAPWAARALAADAPTSDVWLGMADVSNATFLRDKPPPDMDAEERFGWRVGVGLFRTVHRFGVGLDLGDRVLHASLDIQVDAPRSVLQVELLGQPGRAGTAPPAFFRLPADTGIAFYSLGADPARARRAATPFFHEFVQTFAAEIDPANIVPLENELDALFFTGGPSIAAYGLDIDAARPALHKVLEKETLATADLAQAMDATQGWAIFEVDEPAARWKSGLNEIDHLSQRVVHAPGATQGGAPAGKLDRSTTTTLPVAIRPREHLPAGSLHLHNSTFANPAYTPKPGEDPVVPHESDLYIAPDGDRTWIVWAGHNAVALEKLHTVLTGKRDKTLGGRKDLTGIASLRGNVVGFASLAAGTSLALSADSRQDVELSRYLVDTLWTLPHRGGTALPLVVTSAAEPGGARYAIRGTFDVPRSSLDEILALAMAASRAP